MLDSPLRRLLQPGLDLGAEHLDRSWITPDRITLVGLALGLAAAFASAWQWWHVALVLWLVSRLADGLDGALARRRSVDDARWGQAGGFLDISADVLVYGASVIGIAVGVSSGNGGAPWPFVLLIAAYYFNGATLLAFSSTAERAGRPIDDGRSISFMPTYTGATTTILAHSLMMLFPASASVLATVWALLVMANALRQIVVGYRHLS